MMFQPKWIVREAAALACCALVLAVGCTNEAPRGGVVASGTLLEGGQPAALADYEEEQRYYELEFVPLGDDGSLQTGVVFKANVAADGSFEVRNFDDSGITPGKYRVGVYKMAMNDEEGAPADEWNEKFAPQYSSITVDIQEGAPVEVDIANAESAAPENPT